MAAPDLVVDVVSSLINQGLHWAIVNGHLDVVKLLCKNNFDDELKKACRHGQLPIVQYLAEIGANVNNGCLDFAARNGHLNVIKYLVEQKLANVRGSSIEAAVLANSLETVKYLHSQGADLCARSNMALQRSAEEGYLDIVEYIVENLENVEESLTSMGFALIMAKHNGRMDVVKFLEREIHARQ